MYRFPRELLAAAFPNQPRLWRAFEDQDKAVSDQSQRITGTEQKVAVTAATASNALAAAKSAQPASDNLASLVQLSALPGALEQESAGVFNIRPIDTADGRSLLSRAIADTRYATANVTGAGYVTSFNTRTGAITLTSGDVTTALTYTPTSVTGLTGVYTVTAFKTGLSLVKSDVGLGSVDNTADVAKAVLSASKLTTARTINGVAFDGTANITIAGSAAGYTVVAKSAAYTEATSTGDLLILASGAFTITLPTAVGNTATLTVKVTATGPIVVAAAAAQTIDGSATISLALGNAATLRSDNANWWVV